MASDAKSMGPYFLPFGLTAYTLNIQSAIVEISHCNINSQP
jgi:hypothetical protein